MKNIFIILLLIGCVIRSSAQNLQVTPGAKIKSANNAFIVLDNMAIINNGTFVTGQGTTKLTGNADATISGSSVTTFDKLDIAKSTSSRVILRQNVNVGGQIIFTTGLLDLDNSVLDLGTTGLLSGETEAKRILTLGNGYVQVVNVLNAPASANPGNLGAVISSIKNLGTVTIRRGHLAQPNVSGTTPGIRRYYDILPAVDNGLKATLRFRYFDVERTDFNEATLTLWKQSTRSWSNEGYTSRSAADNYVEKTGIGTLSRWTLSGTPNSTPVTAISKDALNETAQIKNGLFVWPNPTSQLVNVSIQVTRSSAINLKIYDAAGSLVLLQHGKLSAGKNMMSIDMNKLPAGAYKLIAECESGFRQIKQIIKQ